MWESQRFGSDIKVLFDTFSFKKKDKTQRDKYSYFLNTLSSIEKEPIDTVSMGSFFVQIIQSSSLRKSNFRYEA